MAGALKNWFKNTWGKVKKGVSTAAKWTAKHILKPVAKFGLKSLGAIAGVGTALIPGAQAFTPLAVGAGTALGNGLNSLWEKADAKAAAKKAAKQNQTSNKNILKDTKIKPLSSIDDVTKRMTGVIPAYRSYNQVNTNNQDTTTLK